LSRACSGSESDRVLRFASAVKKKNYEDFKKAAILIENKAHLTRKGLDELKIIKGRMNKRRKAVLRRDV